MYFIEINFRIIFQALVLCHLAVLSVLLCLSM